MMTIIFGANGAGKSSLMAHLLNQSAFDYERIRAGREEVQRLNEAFGYNIPTPKHFTYVNGTAIFQRNGYSKRMNLSLDPARLGIQSEAPEGVKCQFILPYATLGIDEAQTWFPSRDGAVQNYQFSFFEKHRHNNLNILFSTTRAKLIDLRIRALCDAYYVKERPVDEDKNGNVKVTWYVDHIPVGCIDSYLDAGPTEQKYYCEKEKIVAKYNVFDIYDPTSCKTKFYEGFNGPDFNFTYGAL